MLPAVASLFMRRRSPALQLAHRTVVLAFLVVAFATTACSKESTSPAGHKLSYGPSLALGQGVARTFVTTDAAGNPTTLGVALSEAAMTGLPQVPMPGMPSGAMLILQFPAAAASTGFDHVMLDWNPAGHEPEHVYTLPHFDFHFYQITSAVRESIMPTNPDWATKAGSFPSAEYVPAGYVAGSVLAGIPAPAASVPMMGMHWLDVASGELQPPPNNRTFTSTFIYGTWDGTFIFLEPMITKAYIESVKDKPAGITLAVGVAQKVQKAGAYPNAYSIKYDTTAREYRITLEALVMRQ